MGLAVIGLFVGYIPLGHYLMQGAIPSCPAAPVHGHTILLSFLGMTVFGLGYRALPTWMGDTQAPLGLIRAHFWLAVVGVIGVTINGTFGYELLGTVQPNFYYLAGDGAGIRDLWFGIDGIFLTLYGIGCLIFLHVFMTRTSYSTVSNPGPAKAVLRAS
jgi:nitric oxide reductase large subunit